MYVKTITLTQIINYFLLVNKGTNKISLRKNIFRDNIKSNLYSIVSKNKFYF